MGPKEIDPTVCSGQVQWAGAEMHANAIHQDLTVLQHNTYLSNTNNLSLLQRRANMEARQSHASPKKACMRQQLAMASPHNACMNYS
jgi:hypothetical protein